jgi:5-methylcytosine-specific restriction endonuclease McrA
LVVSDAAEVIRRKSYGFDFLRTLSQKIGDLSGFVPMCRELIQNADDEECSWISFEFQEDALVVRNPSIFSERDWANIRTIGAEGKRDDATKTGRFGIGFVSVFQVCDHPQITSGKLTMTILPEEQETRESDCESTEETVFYLPWATESSDVRNRLSKPRVTKEEIPHYCDQLVEHLLESMLFLRRVRTVRVKHLDGRSLEARRSPDKEAPLRSLWLDEVKAHGDPKRIDESCWIVFERSEHENTNVSGIERNGSVAVALPIIGSSQDPVTGWLYTTLPTRTHTDLPISVNGDFAIKSDRMTIVDEGNREEIEWNKRLIDTLAELYVSSMMEARNLVDHRDFAGLFPSGSYSNPSCPMLAGIPARFIERARDEEILPTKKEGIWALPSEARLLSRKTSEALYDTVAEKGVAVVVPELSNQWNMLSQSLGVPRFSIQDLLDLCEAEGMDDTVVPRQFGGLLESQRGQEAIWQYIEDELKGGKGTKQVGVGREIPLCPCSDGVYRRFKRVNVPAPGIVEALPSLTEHYPLVSTSFLQSHPQLCEFLCEKLPWETLLEVIGSKTQDEIAGMVTTRAINLDALYRLIALHTEDFRDDRRIAQSFAALGIFPTEAGSRLMPLSTPLYLPGGFDDPIGLDILLATNDLPDAFIGACKAMGLEKLTLQDYATRVVPYYFANHERFGSKDQRVALLNLIRKRASELAESPEVLALLREQPCVLCRDGQYYAPSKVYVGFDGLEDIFSDCPQPDVVYGDVEQDESLRRFFADIGASAKPRMADLVHAIRAIAARPQADGLGQIEKIFYYLANVVDELEDDERHEVEQLASVEWLPVDGSDDYCLPGDVFLRSQANLVGRQGKILRFGRQALMKRSFHQAIGLTTQPEPNVLISNLRDLKEQGEPAIANIYRALNDLVPKLEPRHRHALATEPLLFIALDGVFCLGSTVYYSAHPFGPYRHVLDEELKGFRPLVHDVIRVRDSVEEHDYVEVLIDITQQDRYTQRHDQLSDTDASFVRMIYSHLSRCIEGQEDEDEDAGSRFGVFAGKAVVATRSHQLRPPDLCFLADKEWLIRLFEERVSDLLVDNDPTTRPFMTSIGVKSLSAAVRALDFEEPGSRAPSPFQDCLRARARERQFARIVETFRKRYPGAKWHLRSMLNTEIWECESLQVEYALVVRGQSLTAGINDVDSYFEEDTQAMYVCRDLASDDQKLEVSRQLASILCPDLDASVLASPLSYVLDYNRSDDQVRDTLSRLGMDEVEGSVPVGVVGGGAKGRADTILEEPTSSGTTGQITGGSGGGHAGGGGGRQTPATPEPEPTADETRDARRRIFRKKASFYAEREAFEAGTSGGDVLDDERRPLTDEEREDHMRQVEVFYNRQIRNIERRLHDLRDGEEAYDIYSSEWDEISELIRERDGYKCRRCGTTDEELKSAGSHLTVHHIVPRKKGGSNWHSNLITLCISCHREVEEAPELL